VRGGDTSPRRRGAHGGSRLFLPRQTGADSPARLPLGHLPIVLGPLIRGDVRIPALVRRAAERILFVRLAKLGGSAAAGAIDEGLEIRWPGSGRRGGGRRRRSLSLAGACLRFALGYELIESAPQRLPPRGLPVTA
jgi:hypothetical protein